MIGVSVEVEKHRREITRADRKTERETERHDFLRVVLKLKGEAYVT
jgi:hypothetical protein